MTSGREGDAVTHVERGGVPALAEAAVGVPRPAEMDLGEGHDLGLEATNQHVEALAALEAQAPFGGDRGLEERGRGDEPSPG